MIFLFLMNYCKNLLEKNVIAINENLIESNGFNF